MPEPKWERMSINHGYIIVHCSDHPHANPAGYVYLHRLAMEHYVGRLLERHEHVHHRDENKWNNDRANLVIVTNSEHGRLHGIARRTPDIALTCSFCHREFRRRFHQRPKVKGYKKAYCSRRCMGKAFWKRDARKLPIVEISQ
jgi:uncharacterized protein (DUF1330 family)